MPELRTDWLTGRRVIIAENRAARPNEFGGDSEQSVAAGTHASVPADQHATIVAPANCPFCPGHEGETPQTVYEQCDDGGHWRVRVFPNKFPAVTFAAPDHPVAPIAPVVVEAIVAEFPCAELSYSTAPDPDEASHWQLFSPALGAQEVIIESARHVTRTGALSARRLRDVLRAYAARLKFWRDDGRTRYALLFKNQGASAGASLSHLHSQLLVLPDVPPSVAPELSRAHDSYRHHRTCPYCRWIERERAHKQRIILDRDGYVAFCPSASVQPLEFWILPGEHQPSFELLDADALDRLAEVSHLLIERLESLLPVASYNMLLRTGPWIAGVDDWCHWRIEVLPRVSTFAGLELGTGIYINSFAPERAAERLRASK